MFTAPDTTLRAAPPLTHTPAWFSGPAVPPGGHRVPAGSPVPLRHAAEDRIAQGTEDSECGIANLLIVGGNFIISSTIFFFCLD